jgi:hypothetical protein
MLVQSTLVYTDHKIKWVCLHLYEEKIDYDRDRMNNTFINKSLGSLLT